MANPCPVCHKEFASKNALKNHTGSNKAALRRAHICAKCEQVFCSQKAMEQHGDASSHTTMFSCDVCDRSFASKQAIEEHNKKSSLHAQRLAQANLGIENVIDVPLNPASAPFVQPKSRRRAAPATSIKSHVRAIWDDDQDWILCDKDCGWCGHCADGVDF